MYGQQYSLVQGEVVITVKSGGPAPLVVTGVNVNSGGNVTSVSTLPLTIPAGDSAELKVNVSGYPGVGSFSVQSNATTGDALFEVKFILVSLGGGVPGPGPTPGPTPPDNGSYPWW
jgi:hypothetical protein